MYEMKFKKKNSASLKWGNAFIVGLSSSFIIQPGIAY